MIFLISLKVQIQEVKCSIQKNNMQRNNTEIVAVNSQLPLLHSVAYLPRT